MALPLIPDPSSLPVAAAGGAEHVTANYRYISVYNEVVVRIGQRQQTLTLFVAIFTGLVTALIASRELFRSQALALDWLMAGFPAASISLTLLNTKYERLLSILRGYLASLERIGDAHLRLPSFNCDERLIEQANSARHYHDVSCAVLVIVYNLVAIGVFSSIAANTGPLFIGIAVAVGTVALGCVAAHLGMRRARYRPLAPAQPPR